MAGMEANDSVATSASRVTWDDAGVWKRSGFAAFLKAHGIERSDLVSRENGGQAHVELRYFRVKHHGGAVQTDDDVAQRVVASLRRNGEQVATPQHVAWVPGFFSLPATTRLASIDMYQRGELYGIDISSGYAVSLLDVQPGEHVLDLCCAPGAKLTMIADLLQMRGSVTGVDFSRPRIGACKQLVHKYRLVRPEGEETSAVSWRCRLFHADGRLFDVGPCAEWHGGEGVMEVVLDSDEVASRSAKSQGRKRLNKSARAREAKRLKAIGGGDPAQQAGDASDASEARRDSNTPLYDKVLVDAECTHDGSIKHLQKLESEDAWKAYVADHLSDAEISRILSLQGELIRTGFKLLRPGGTMIYSTCSLSIKQNEEIVAAFLEETANATLQPVDATGIPCEAGKLAGTLRFTPAHHTSGLFIAKIVKTRVREG